MQGYAVTGRVFCLELGAGAAATNRTGGFVASNALESAEAMSRTVAGLLRLAPRAATSGDTDKTSLVWAVLPFTCLVPWEGSTTLEDEAETALLGLQGQRQVVERRRLQQMLDEASLQQTEPGKAANADRFAQTVTADRLLVGMLSQVTRGLRLDLHLLDARTGIIVGAEKREELSANDVVAALKECTARLVRREYSRPTGGVVSRDARLQEARFLQDRNTLPQGSPDPYRNWQRSRWDSELNAAQGVCLLLRDDPVAVYRTMVGLSHVLRGLPFDTRPGKWMYMPTMDWGCALIDKALQEIAPAPATPAPWLYRANALMYVERYAEALSLVEKHIRQFPDVEASLAHEIKAVILLSMNQLDAARQVVADGRRLGLDMGGPEARIRQIEETTAAAAATGAGERAEYEFLRERFSVRRRYSTGAGFGDALAFERYLELMRKFESPASCLRECNGILKAGSLDSAWNWQVELGHFPMAMYRAFAMEALGKRQDAVGMAQMVLEACDKPSVYRFTSIENARKLALQLIRRSESATNAAPVLWKTVPDIRPLPVDSRVYVVPVGQVEERYVNGVASSLGELLRTEVGIVERANMPPHAPDDGENTFREADFMRNLLSKAAIPADAQFVLYLTAATIEQGHLPYFNPDMLSLAGAWNGPSETAAQVVSMILAAEAFGSFVHAVEEVSSTTLASGRCAGFPCRNRSSGHFSAMLTRLCPACENQYARVDYTRMKQQLARTIQEAGGRLVPPGECRISAPVKPTAVRKITPPADGTVFAVPHVGTLKVDGDPSDWGTNGMACGELADDMNVVPAETNLQVEFRLGWNQTGLAILVSVRDDVFCEDPRLSLLWRMDSVEMFVGHPGKTNRYQVALAPGMAKEQPNLRFNLYDYRTRKTPQLQIQAARTKVEGGYTMEILLPWTNLNMEPVAGSVLAFQIMVNDSDKFWGHPDDWKRILWYPRGNTYEDPDMTYRLKLAGKD